MHYIGGKFYLRHKIAAVLYRHNPNVPFYEPFVGACNICTEVPFKELWLNDVSRDLIDMWRAACDGVFVPPERLSENEYWILQHSPSSPLRTFAGYACSFGGRWWGGYAREDTSDRNAANNRALYGKNSILEKVRKLEGKKVRWTAGDYSAIRPAESVVYCDPPYLGTKAPGEGGIFNHGRFWNYVRSLVLDYKNNVYISELQAPSDFVSIRHWPTQRMMRNDESNIIGERLFVHESQANGLEIK